MNPLKTPKELETYKFWFMQMIFAVMFIAEVVYGLIALILGYFHNPWWYALTPFFAISGWTTWQLLKTYGWPMMGIKSAAQTLFKPGVEEYYKNKEKEK